MHDPYRALYVHLPFCVSRCAYCDFTTHAVPADDREIDEYIDHLVLDVRRKAREGELGSIETVYIGGGTPSHVGLARLSKLLYTLSLSMHLTPEVECTMEVNPESLTESMVKDIWALGVNRLSIGVQSFDDDVLGVLGRVHTADDARRAIEMAHMRFENVSVDLMCGIPGQSVASFEGSVREAIRMEVGHVSVYPLTVEPHTPFDAAVLSGVMSEPDDDVAAAHMELAARILAESDFERYEVASYARPGFVCRHNIAYWTGVPYLGLGQSAVTMTQCRDRRMRLQDGRVTDDLNARQMTAEDLMLGMRLARGISDDQVKAASMLLPNTGVVLEGIERLGLIIRHGDHWRPTERGWLCGNELYGRLLDLAP